MLKLAIITPSYISSDERAGFARCSLASLRQAIGDRWLHIVVDDIPRGKGWLGRRLPGLRHLGKASQIYNGPNIQLFRQFGRSSVAATLRAVREARRAGCELVFIHLDDNVYLPILGDLLDYTVDACQRDADLLAVRLTGYPILSRQCTPESGNRTQLHIEADTISFDSVCLKPSRYPGYTLWWSPYNEAMMEGGFWAIPMWFTVYRTEFLEKLLTLNDRVASLRALNLVELYYKDMENWKHALSHFSGKLGYINMQFGGLEMERNKNWRELINLPNVAVK